MEEDTAVECEGCEAVFDDPTDLDEDGRCASCVEDAALERDHHRVESHSSIFI